MTVQTLPAPPTTHPAPIRSTSVKRPTTTTSSPPTVDYRGTVPRAPADAPWDRLRLYRPEARLSARQQARALEDLAASPIPTEPAGPWAAALSRMCVEALLGMRSATQLQRWLTPALYDAVSRRAGLAARILGRAAGVPRPRIISHHAQIAENQRTAEVCVILHDGTKVRAIALKLEAFRGRWRASAIEIG